MRAVPLLVSPTFRRARHLVYTEVAAGGGWPTDPEQVHAELDRVRKTFHRLVETSSAAELRRPTDGTRWTNSQLLFHMLLGYFVVRSLLGLVRTLGRMPDGVSRRFARVLNLDPPMRAAGDHRWIQSMD
jgi:hypothetical protein